MVEVFKTWTSEVDLYFRLFIKKRKTIIVLNVKGLQFSSKLVQVKQYLRNI